MVPYDYLMMSLPDLMMLVVVIITDFPHIWINFCNPKWSMTRMRFKFKLKISIQILTLTISSVFSLNFSDVVFTENFYNDILNISFRWKQMIWHQLLTISWCQHDRLRKFSIYIHRLRIFGTQFEQIFKILNFIFWVLYQKVM